MKELLRPPRKWQMPSFEEDLDRILFDLADRIMKYYDPCHLDVDGCLVGRPNPCCSKRTTFPRQDPNDDRCRYLSDDAKCLNANLGCRYWLCNTAVAAVPEECMNLLRAIETIGRHYGLISPPFFGDSYVGADRPR